MRLLASVGPRTRRRLAWLAGIGAVVVVVGVTAYLVTRPAGGSSDPFAGQPVHYGEMNLGIPYGTPSKKVMRELGAPTERRGDCWLYRGRVGRIRGRYSGFYVDAMKFCFSPAGPGLDKTVSRIFSHDVAHTFKKKTILARWDVPLVIAKIPNSYAQGGS